MLQGDVIHKLLRNLAALGLVASLIFGSMNAGVAKWVKRWGNMEPAEWSLALSCAEDEESFAGERSRAENRRGRTGASL